MNVRLYRYSVLSDYNAADLFSTWAEVYRGLWKYLFVYLLFLMVFLWLQVEGAVCEVGRVAVLVSGVCFEAKEWDRAGFCDCQMWNFDPWGSACKAGNQWAGETYPKSDIFLLQIHNINKKSIFETALARPEIEERRVIPQTLTL